jgi:hypothetical protein
LDWQLLTKRPWNAYYWWNRQGESVLGRGAEAWWPSNAWIGTTVENQEWADKRIKWLLRIPADVRFLSCEPLLGPIDLSAICPDDRLDWVIAGGESGPKARPSHPDWFRSLRDQCQSAGVPYFFKQHGEWIPKSHTNRAHPWHLETRPGPRVEVGPNLPWGTIGITGSFFPETTPFNGHDDDGTDPTYPEAIMLRAGKEASGRLLDGVEWSQFPEVVKSRPVGGVE